MAAIDVMRRYLQAVQRGDRLLLPSLRPVAPRSASTVSVPSPTTTASRSWSGSPALLDLAAGRLHVTAESAHKSRWGTGAHRVGSERWTSAAPLCFSRSKVS
jgi:hypothetical protein